MEVLVVGRAGKLARALQEADRPAGIRLRALARGELDLRDRRSIETDLDGVRPDVVINTAAYTAVDRAEAEPDLAAAINADGPALLAEACRDRGIAVLHVSTDYVFDGTKGAPYVETDATAPLGVYGETKLRGEERLRAILPRHLILRTAWLHAPYGESFVSTMLRLGETHETVRVVADQHGNPTYAPHLAAAIVAILARIGEADAAAAELWGTYHAAGAGEASWADFAERIFDRARAHGIRAPRVERITTADYPTPAKRPLDSRLDCAKLKRTFNVTLPHWTRGVDACVDRLLQAASVASVEKERLRS